MRHMMVGLTAATLALITAQAPVTAQEWSNAAAPAVKASYRTGLWGGGGFGGASMGCLDDCDGREGGGAWFGKIGGTISPHIRVGGAVNGWTNDHDNVSRSVGTVTFQTQWFPKAGNFYLLGGIGAAWAERRGDVLASDRGGAAFQFGTGYSINLGSRKKIALVPELSWQITTIDRTVDFWQLGVGFFWN